MSHHLGKAGLEINLKIEVRVNIEHPRYQPATLSVDDLSGYLSREIFTSRDNPSFFHGHILNRGQAARSVKNLGATD